MHIKDILFNLLNTNSNYPLENIQSNFPVKENFLFSKEAEQKQNNFIASLNDQTLEYSFALDLETSRKISFGKSEKYYVFNYFFDDLSIFSGSQGYMMLYYDSEKEKIFSFYHEKTKKSKLNRFGILAMVTTIDLKNNNIVSKELKYSCLNEDEKEVYDQFRDYILEKNKLKIFAVLSDF